MNIQKIYRLSLIALVTFINSYSMESADPNPNNNADPRNTIQQLKKQNKDTQQDDNQIVTLITEDGGSCTLPKQIAKKIPFLNDMLESLPSTEASIPLPALPFLNKKTLEIISSELQHPTANTDSEFNIASALEKVSNENAADQIKDLEKALDFLHIDVSTEKNQLVQRLTNQIIKNIEPTRKKLDTHTTSRLASNFTSTSVCNYTARVTGIVMDGDHIIASYGTGPLAIWEKNTLNRIALFRDELAKQYMHDSVLMLATDKNNIIAAQYNTIEIWDRQYNLVKKLKFDSEISSLVAQNGKLLVGSYSYSKAGIRNNHVKIFDLETHNCLKIISVPNEINCLQLTENKLILGSNKTIEIVDFDTGDHLKTLEGHSGSITTLIVEDKRIISACDTLVKIWDLNTYQCIQTLTGHTQPINGVSILKNKIISSDAHTIKVWKNGVCILSIKMPQDYDVSYLTSDDNAIIIGDASNIGLNIFDLTPYNEFEDFITADFENIYAFNLLNHLQQNKLKATFTEWQKELLQRVIKNLRQKLGDEFAQVVERVFILVKKNEASPKNPTQTKPQEELTDNQCIICFEEIPAQEKPQTKCGHNQFHLQCIEQWKDSRAICPICRTNLVVVKKEEK